MKSPAGGHVPEVQIVIPATVVLHADERFQGCGADIAGKPQVWRYVRDQSLFSESGKDQVQKSVLRSPAPYGKC